MVFETEPQTDNLSKWGINHYYRSSVVSVGRLVGDWIQFSYFSILAWLPVAADDGSTYTTFMKDESKILFFIYSLPNKLELRKTNKLQHVGASD